MPHSTHPAAAARFAMLPLADRYQPVEQEGVRSKFSANRLQEIGEITLEIGPDPGLNALLG